MKETEINVMDELNKGASMGMDAISYVMEKVEDSNFKDLLNTQYEQYENFDALEVPYYDAIPSDYDGMMGVPRSFLDKYCPEQFEIIGVRRLISFFGFLAIFSFRSATQKIIFDDFVIIGFVISKTIGKRSCRTVIKHFELTFL